jgi:SAM-dependent methyltransferase
MNMTDFLDKPGLFPDNLANPDGFFGEVVGGYISMVFEPLNQWAVQRMQIQPGDAVLEIGFGPGMAIQKMIENTPVGCVVGLDNSALMLRKATELNRLAIESGKVKLMQADVCHLPEFGQKFDKIVAINTTMYWPAEQLGRIFKNLRKCLVPGGMLFVVVQRLYEHYERGDKNAEVQGYLKLLHDAGFVEVKGTVQGVADREAAIAEGRCIGIALYGTNPAFLL